MVEDVIFFKIPKEIRDFYKDVFEVYEVRGIIEQSKGLKFIVHTRDHNPPHIHAKYDKYEISISLIDFKVLAGNIPEKNKNIAIKWVKKNKEYLLNYWNNKTITSSAHLTKSRLDWKETIKM